MGGRGGTSPTGRGVSAQERAFLQGGNMPAALPGFRYEEELQRVLDAIGQYYVRPQAIRDWLAENELRVEYDEDGFVVYVGTMSSGRRHPLNDRADSITDAQRNAYIEWLVYQMARSRGVV